MPDVGVDTGVTTGWNILSKRGKIGRFHDGEAYEKKRKKSEGVCSGDSKESPQPGFQLRRDRRTDFHSVFLESKSLSDFDGFLFVFDLKGKKRQRSLGFANRV